jgi:hypothetical protein
MLLDWPFNLRGRGWLRKAESWAGPVERLRLFGLQRRLHIATIGCDGLLPHAAWSSQGTSHWAFKAYCKGQSNLIGGSHLHMIDQSFLRAARCCGQTGNPEREEQAGRIPEECGRFYSSENIATSLVVANLIFNEIGKLMC